MISPNSSRKLSDKLMILYAYYIYNAPVEMEHINKIMLNTGLIDYFSLMDLSHELIDDELIKMLVFTDVTDHKYMITKLGHEHLSALMDKIQIENKKIIYKSVQANRDYDPEINGIIANFNKISEDDYQVNLKLLDNSESLVEITLKAPTNAIAQKIVNTWNNNAIEIFRHLIDEFDKY